MTADDETRIMPSADLRRLRYGAPSVDVGETPCVGVASVGDTHFGETQAVVRPDCDGTPTQPRSDDNDTAVFERAKASSASRTPSWRLPRPLALLLGATVGIGLGLVVALGRSGAQDTRSDRPATTQVSIVVRTPEGRGLGNVPVRVENQIVLTESSGDALFDDVEMRGGLNVGASCPDGHSGRALSREIPHTVARTTKSWEFELVCQPDFVDVVLLIETSGCGEMKIWWDGVEMGKTQGERMRVTRRLHQDEVAEVRAAPLEGRCEMDPLRHVALSPREPSAHVVFQGVRARPRARPSKKADSRASTRPYRL